MGLTAVPEARGTILSMATSLGIKTEPTSGALTDAYDSIERALDRIVARELIDCRNGPDGLMWIVATKYHKAVTAEIAKIPGREMVEVEPDLCQNALCDLSCTVAAHLLALIDRYQGEIRDDFEQPFSERLHEAGADELPALVGRRILELPAEHHAPAAALRIARTWTANGPRPF